MQVAVLAALCFFVSSATFAQNVPFPLIIKVNQVNTNPQSPVKTDESQKASQSSSQTPEPAIDQTPTPSSPNTSTGAKAFFKEILKDQKTFWLSPLQIHKSDCRWLIPFAVATTTLIATDRHLSSKIDTGEDKQEVSSFISRAGEGYIDFGIAGGIFAIGKLSHNDRVTETGALGIKALINSSLIVTGLKFITQRERPNTSEGDGHFFERGHSFPSGHSITVWSLATVIAEEYREKPLVRIAAYGLASAVSIARVTGRNHFASDVLVGSTLGYFIGHYTVKHFSKHQGKSVSTSLSPYLNPKTNTYGAAALLNF